MNKTKGFSTIATGKEEYYRLAANLLQSYRHFCDEPLPFALLADRENEFTAAFDDVLIFENGATNSYLDKLSLGEYLPYDINIFIDADCLAYGNLNQLFEIFDKADDFSCFGRVLPLDDKTGWFEYENLGELKERVSYIVGLHGGIYYIRRGEMTCKIFDQARAMVPDYAKYGFKGKFDTPGDEPLVALAMALHGCHPIPFVKNAICCYWEHVGQCDLDISSGKAVVKETPQWETMLMHWGTRYTRELLYKREAEVLCLVEQTEPNDQAQQVQDCRRKYDRMMRAEKCKRFRQRVYNKLQRMMKRK